MYASPASLLRLPAPRRRLTWGKFTPAGHGRPPVMRLRGRDARQYAPAEWGCPLVCSWGAGTPLVMHLWGVDAQRSYSGGFWVL
jgi:hypothetical protein